jgi:beta-glucuronidase
MDTKRIFLSNKFWRFRFGLQQSDKHEDPGIVERWYESQIPSSEQKLKVYVPSTWSYYQNQKNFYHFGTGWYETSFYLPEAWGSGDGKKITLVFNGSNYKTTVWLNGKNVGFHEGGYSKFWFEINEFVKFGADNLLVIQVDNRYMEGRLPWFQSPDWMNYGGIYRSVYLKLTSQVNIDDFKITNTIAFDTLTKDEEGNDHASSIVNIRNYIKNTSLYQKSFEGSLIISIRNSHFIDSTEIPIKFGKNAHEIVEANIKIDNAYLWSPDHPYLYNLTFQLLDKNRRELDRENYRWGIRIFEIKVDKFFLNNEPIVLRGINRHEDHPEVGSSMSPRLIYNDLNIMKEAHINCIRTAHYPPYEALLEMADEMGFIILEEIPICGLNINQYTDQYLINAQQQLWEMIHRDKNHPSVIAWVISNECDTNSSQGRDFMKKLLEVSRELDPFRFHSLVTHKPFMDNTMDLVDFVCVNIYVGWYNQYETKPEDVSKILDNIKDRIDNDEEVGGTKPLVISEFGAGAIAGFKSFAQAHWSENYQYKFLETYIKIMIEKGYVAGSFIWHFQDFRCSPFKDFQHRPKEYNNKGIVDMHRNPKISYYKVAEMYKKWKLK